MRGEVRAIDMSQPDGVRITFNVGRIRSEDIPRLLTTMEINALDCQEQDGWCIFRNGGYCSYERHCSKKRGGFCKAEGE